MLVPLAGGGGGCAGDGQQDRRLAGLPEASKPQAQATLSRLQKIVSKCVEVGLTDFEGQLTNSGWADLMGSTKPPKKKLKGTPQT